MIKYIIVGIVLVALYTYMYKRMIAIEKLQNKGEYTPNYGKSTIELVGFIFIYLGCAILSTQGLASYGELALITLGALAGSFLVFNKFHYDRVGAFSVVLASALMIGYYVWATI